MQADRLGTETWVLTPKQMHAANMAAMQQPALPLHHPLYGEEDANATFTKYLHSALIRQGWRELSSSGGETIYLRRSVILGVYVDDGIVMGKRSECVQYVCELSHVVKLKKPESLKLFLGVNAKRVLDQGVTKIVLEQRDYTRVLVENLRKS